MSVLLEARDLTVSYRVGSTLWARVRGHAVPEVHAIEQIDLVVERGSVVGIVGESGCGKSTLAKALVGLAPLAGGSITLDGETLSPRRTPQQTRRVQMVFQDPSASLDPSMTIGQTLRELLRVHRMVAPADVQARAEELMRRVELPVSLLQAYPRRLSGGQRQRVGIARALALEPEVLVADESVAALDVSVQAAILNLLQRLRAELGLTILFISHDLAVVRHLCDRVVVMYLGTVVEDRPTEELFEDPRHPYTAALLSSAPRLGFEKLSGGSALSGEPGSLHSVPSGCRFHPRCPVARDECADRVPALAGPTPDQRAACHFAWDPDVVPPERPGSLTRGVDRMEPL